MKTLTAKQTVQRQFDFLVKRVVDTTIKDYARLLSRHFKYESCFSDISETELKKIGATDEYCSDFTTLEVQGYTIFIKDERLYDALISLPKKKRNIILMFYFLDMSDAEISNMMSYDRILYEAHHLAR